MFFVSMVHIRFLKYAPLNKYKASENMPWLSLKIEAPKPWDFMQYQNLTRQMLIFTNAVFWDKFTYEGDYSFKIT
jgi:hypothetical protein